MRTSFVVLLQAPADVLAVTTGLQAQGFTIHDALAYGNYEKKGPALVFVIEGPAPVDFEARVRALAIAPAAVSRATSFPLQSPNGTVWLVSVDDAGVLSTSRKGQGVRRV